MAFQIRDFNILSYIQFHDHHPTKDACDSYVDLGGQYEHRHHQHYELCISFTQYINAFRMNLTINGDWFLIQHSPQFFKATSKF
jgi:hypothetical protein